MITVEHSLTIKREPADVFDYVVDPANSTKWDDELVESKLLSDGPIGVGSLISEKRKFLGRDMDSEMEVTAFDPGKIFAVKVKSGPVPFEISYVLSSADGGTKIDLKAEGEPAGFFKLAGGMLAKELKKSLETTTAKLKEILEA